MRLSSSTLDTFIKCGYKYKLTKVDNLREPGKMTYGTLEGKVVGLACQRLAEMINKQKSLSLEDMNEQLYLAYETEYMLAKIDPDILIPIRELLIEGVSTYTMNHIDKMSIVISCSPSYNFSAPAPVKKTDSYSTDKRRLGMKILKTQEAVQNFFHPTKQHMDLIKNADVVEAEKYFEYIVRDNGPDNEPDYIPGYLDQYLAGEFGEVILEYKYKSQPYTYEVVQITNQLQVYQWAFPEARVILCDLAHDAVYPLTEPSDKVKLKYRLAIQAIENDIFIPFCGVDSYSTKMMLCGFKCGGCEYAPKESVDVLEGALE